MAEQGGIPLSWLIEVNSTGVREAFSLSKLHTIAITKYNPLLPVTRWNKFYDSDSVAKTFGFNSVEANFANNYFGVVNKRNSKADLLTIYNWNENATPATIKGAMLKDLDYLRSIKGNFSLSIGSDTKQVSADFTKANSYTDCATILQQAINKVGEASATTLDITKGEDTPFEITKAGDSVLTIQAGATGSPTNILTISTDNYEVTQDNDHVTFNRDTKTLTGVSQGTTEFSFKYQEPNKNEVVVKVSVVCQATSLNITPTVKPLVVTKVLLNIVGDNYSVTSNNDHVTFDSDTKSFVGVSNGTTKFTFTRQEPNKNKVNIDISVANQDGALTIAQGVGALYVSEIFLQVNTNAGVYDVTSDNAKATFNKSTGFVKGVSNGTTNFTFKAKYGVASEATRKVTITIAATTLALSANIQAIVTNGSDVNPATPSFKNTEVIYSSLTGGLIVKGGIKGADSTISFLQAPTSGTDISTSLGLSQIEGASIIAGENAQGTLDEVLSLLNEVNGNYYVIDFTFKLDEAQALALATFTNNSNDRFVGIINSDDDLLITSDKALDNIKGYNGVIVNYYKNDKPFGITSGIISSIDYAMENGNINLAFNDTTKFSDIAINTKSEINTLEANFANSILKFAQMGQSQVWYGMGNILGTKTNSANVYIANSYLMFSLQYAFANLFHTQAFIGLRGTFNNGLIINTASDVFSRAVLSGIVVTGAVLTDIEKQVIISSFTSDSEAVIKQIQDIGYYVKIGNVDTAKQTLNITTAYVANKNLKRIIINNYILGA